MSEEKLEIEVKSDQTRCTLARLSLPWVNNESSSSDLELQGKVVIGPYAVLVNGSDSGFTTDGVEVQFNEDETVSVIINYLAMEESFANLVGINLSEDGEISSKSIKLDEFKIAGPGPSCGCLTYSLKNPTAKLEKFKFSADEILKAKVVFTGDKLNVKQGC